MVKLKDAARFNVALGDMPSDWQDVTIRRIRDQDVTAEITVLRYGGIIIPDGPGCGEVTVVDGIITDWVMPTTRKKVEAEFYGPVMDRIDGVLKAKI